jgi:transposase InsO family protein
MPASGRPAPSQPTSWIAASKPTPPNRKWIADFTYIWTAEGWLYLAAVIDLFSRRVVGWSMQANMTAQLVADTLMMAIWRRGKPDMMLHHFDQGSQYTSEQFQRLLADHGIVCSMSRSGNVWDNSAMESFFSSLKIERTDRKTTAPATRPKQTSSTTSSASTIPGGVTRRSARRAPRSSR